MKLSAREEYGLRCLLQVAAAPDHFLTIPEVARREALSEAYVAKLTSVLRRAELLVSVRGKKGGVALARPPFQITVAHVLEVLGGRLHADDFCIHHSGERRVCVHNVDCSLRAVWSALDAAFAHALGKMTVGHLLCGEREAEIRLRFHAAAPEPKRLPLHR